MLGMNKLYVEELASTLSGDVTTHLRAAKHELIKSLAQLNGIELGFEKLVAQARKIGYVGNPLVGQLKSASMEREFEGLLVLPTTKKDIWAKLESRISEHNILATLEWEQAEFGKLKGPTEELLKIFDDLIKVSEVEGGERTVEFIENNVIPLRQHYAKVFSLWNHLHAMFLYSALLMTELFYRANGYPSLTDVSLMRNKEQVA